MGWKRQAQARVAQTLAGFSLIGLIGCDSPPNELARIKTTGVLQIAVRAVPERAPHTPVHLERELTERFAQWLGVEPRFIVHTTPAHAFGRVAAGGADLAATADGLPARFQETLLTGPTIRSVERVVVYRRKHRRPRTASELEERTLLIAEGAAAEDEIPLLPSESVEIDRRRDTPVLLEAVWRKQAGLSTATTEYLSSLQLRYPELARAFSLRRNVPVAWVFRRGTDDTLRRAAIHFMNHMRRTGELSRVIDRHLAHLRSFDYVSVRRFIRAMRKRLPLYRADFESWAREYGLDWRWLAAVGYQESHWDPKAVSPTGVRGIMMLTKPTAKGLGVDRNNPQESIRGGARYLAELTKRLPPGIPKHERPWFTLVSYHLGPRHLTGVRTLTARSGGDPDRWRDVEARLPWLRRSAWYSTVPSGRARGHETVHYVRNVRRYHDILRWHLPDPPPGK